MEKTQFEKDLEIKESFIDLLNDVYPEVKIGYSTFTAAEILECCDPIAFAISATCFAKSVFITLPPCIKSPTPYGITKCFRNYRNR